MRFLLLSLLFIAPLVLFAQQKTDSVWTGELRNVNVIGYKTINGTGHMLAVKDGIIYAGKKNEVILVDSLDANKAINNTRQILGRIPGLNIVETESGGFTANGIATRGLNPTQSIEMNTRQNGYNISADVFGYNESYYLPPMEAVSRIEMVRGAASLQFGSQFGGVVNYVLNEAPKNKKIEWNTSQTGGSYGMFNTFNSVGGTINKWSYYAFAQYRTLDGWRPNSQQKQLSGFGRLQYKASSRLSIGVEYSLLRNRIKMPGGLTDSMFNNNPQASYRHRNWIKSPWNIVAANLDYKISDNTSLTIKTSYLKGRRALIWKNEDGGAGALDVPDPVTGQYEIREAEDERMNNVTTEARLTHHYNIKGKPATLAGGVRVAYAWFKQQEGEGTRGSDFDLSFTETPEENLTFKTFNAAAFIENIFQLTKHFSITPGVRFEMLATEAEGETEADGTEVEVETEKERMIPLFGIGAEYKTSRYSNVYANISQAYRPIDYAQLIGFGTSSRIDKDMKDPKGFNADLGYRGIVKNYLNFDIGVFYMAYNKRVGTILMNAGTADEYTLRTNVADSRHMGIESYIEYNIVKHLHPASKQGLSIFNSLAFINAEYTSGEFKGKRVEASTKYVNRVGITYAMPVFSATFQLNNVGDAYGDASNVKLSDNPVAGYIPAYTVADISSTLRIKNFSLKAGINNLFNAMYFTRRTDEYPGPGILPSVGRSFYAGIAAKF